MGNVVLVCWDGTHPDIVRELLTAGKLPTLQSLIAGGRWHDLEFTDQLPDDPTVTKPGHAQMMTGQPKTVTGVYSNHTWGVIPFGMTLPEWWKAAGAKVGWTVEKVHLHSNSPFFHAWQAADYKAEDTTDFGTPAKAITMGLASLEAVRDSRFFMFVHSQFPDHFGHKYGAGSPEYYRTLQENDQELPRLLAALPPNTQVVVITDHAFGHGPKPDCCPTHDGHTHLKCPKMWAVSFPAMALGSRLLDIAPALAP